MKTFFAGGCSSDIFFFSFFLSLFKECEARKISSCYGALLRDWGVGWGRVSGGGGEIRVFPSFMWFSTDTEIYILEQLNTGINAQGFEKTKIGQENHML